MKNLKYMIAIACVALFTACQDKGEWDVPSASDASLYGNNNIVESNVISNKDLIAKYAKEISTDAMTEITEDIQIKGRVTGNDVGGNFYKKITIQDEPANPADSRVITISIDESGIWGYLPIGQEVLVDMKGLWIGGYGYTVIVGTPYTNDKGKTSVGRMSKHLWAQHFKVVGDIKAIEPEVFTTAYMKEKDNFTVGGQTYSLVKNAGKLVVFKNVTFKNADGKETLKSGTEAALKGYFIQEVTQFPGVQFFTSGDYAKFSSWVLPFDEATQKAIPCTLVGIAGYYGARDTWQISIRQTSDISVGETGSGESEGGGGGATGTITRSVEGTTLTLTNNAVTPSSETVTIDFTQFGWTHQQEEPTGTSGGVTFSIEKGEGSTTPKYWKAGTYDEVRLYAKNVFAVTGAKPIAKIVATCTTDSGTDRVGNATLTGTISGNTWTIINEHTSTSGGVQLRMKSAVITYAQ